MKKPYKSPTLTPIGDMVTNTLGASGPNADGGTRRTGGGYGGGGGAFNQQF